MTLPVPLLLKALCRWLSRPRQLLAMLLCFALTASALGVAWAAHITRTQYRDLQTLEKAHDDLEHEYEKLLLEQSAWANYNRVDQLARQELAMKAAPHDELVVLK